MRSKLLFLAAIAMLVIPQAASAQYYDPYGRRYYDDRGAAATASGLLRGAPLLS